MTTRYSVPSVVPLPKPSFSSQNTRDTFDAARMAAGLTKTVEDLRSINESLNRNIARMGAVRSLRHVATAHDGSETLRLARAQLAELGETLIQSSRTLPDIESICTCLRELPKSAQEILERFERNDK